MRLLPLLLAALTLLPLAQSGGPPPARFDHIVCPLLEGHVTGPLERCNVRATAHTGPANEVDLAMDPRDPAHVVLVAKDYNVTRNADAPFRMGAVITVTAASFDGGLTWHEGYLQPMVVQHTLPVLGEVGSTPHHESDPVVTFAPDGAVVAVGLRIGSFFHNSIAVYRSPDGGRTFAEVAEILARFGTDKEEMVADPMTGSLYIASGADGCPCAMRSGDNGLTWSAPAEMPCCIYPYLAVGPAGALYATGYGAGGVGFAKSLDGGQTWSAPVRVAPVRGYASQSLDNWRLFRTPNFPVIGADAARGLVYVAWSDAPPGTTQPPVCVPSPNVQGIVVPTCSLPPNHDIWLSRSADEGQTWSAPLRVNDDPTALAFQFMPAIAVSPRGDVHVAWLDQRFDPTGLTMVTYYAHSADGGRFDANILVSDQPSPVFLGYHQNGQVFVGDYLGLAVSDERAVVAFPDTRYGRSDVFVATVR